MSFSSLISTTRWIIFYCNNFYFLFWQLSSQNLFNFCDSTCTSLSDFVFQVDLRVVEFGYSCFNKWIISFFFCLGKYNDDFILIIQITWKRNIGMKQWYALVLLFFFFSFFLKNCKIQYLIIDNYFLICWMFTIFITSFVNLWDYSSESGILNNLFLFRNFISFCLCITFLLTRIVHSRCWGLIYK